MKEQEVRADIVAKFEAEEEDTSEFLEGVLGEFTEWRASLRQVREVWSAAGVDGDPVELLVSQEKSAQETQEKASDFYEKVKLMYSGDAGGFWGVGGKKRGHRKRMTRSFL